MTRPLHRLVWGGDPLVRSLLACFALSLGASACNEPSIVYGIGTVGDTTDAAGDGSGDGSDADGDATSDASDGGDTAIPDAHLPDAADAETGDADTRDADADPSDANADARDADADTSDANTEDADADTTTEDTADADADTADTDGTDGGDAGPDGVDDAIDDAPDDVDDRCGDGVLDPTEECDDGNADDTDGCTRGCRWDLCSEALVQVAAPIGEAVDVVFVIDTSESMERRIADIETGIASLRAVVSSAEGDPHIVVVASREDRTERRVVEVPPLGPIAYDIAFRGVCVPSLSASGTCPDVDDAPTYVHPDIDVYSKDALERLFDAAYPEFAAALRAHARTHLVVVTDDDSDWTDTEFHDARAALPFPGFSSDYQVHGLIAYRGEPCGEGPGDVYGALALETGGVTASVCSDLPGGFAAVASAIVDGMAESSCTYAVPFSVDSPRDLVLALDGDEGLVPLRRGAADLGCVLGVDWYGDLSLRRGRVTLCADACRAASTLDLTVVAGCPPLP